MAAFYFPVISFAVLNWWLQKNMFFKVFLFHPHMCSCLWWQQSSSLRAQAPHRGLEVKSLRPSWINRNLRPGPCQALLSAAFFQLSQRTVLSKLSNSGQGFSLTSFEKWTAGWIHKRAVCWTICLLTGENIGSHQRVVSVERHSRAWGGTWRPFLLMICPGGGGSSSGAVRHLAPARELGGEKRASVWCQYDSIRAACEQMFGGLFTPEQLKRKDMSIMWRETFRGEQQTLTLSLLHVNPCIPWPSETTQRCPIWTSEPENCMNIIHLIRDRNPVAAQEKL